MCIKDVCVLGASVGGRGRWPPVCAQGRGQASWCMPAHSHARPSCGDSRHACMAEARHLARCVRAKVKPDGSEYAHASMHVASRSQAIRPQQSHAHLAGRAAVIKPCAGPQYSNQQQCTLQSRVHEKLRHNNNCWDKDTPTSTARCLPQPNQSLSHLPQRDPAGWCPRPMPPPTLPPHACVLCAAKAASLRAGSLG